MGLRARALCRREFEVGERMLFPRLDILSTADACLTRRPLCDGEPLVSVAELASARPASRRRSAMRRIVVVVALCAFLLASWLAVKFLLRLMERQNQAQSQGGCALTDSGSWKRLRRGSTQRSARSCLRPLLYSRAPLSHRAESGAALGDLSVEIRDRSVRVFSQDWAGSFKL